MTATKLLLAAATALSGVSALQFPLQNPLQGPKLAGSTSNELSSKPLIDTKALQDTIKAENLEKRAKEFYKLAQLGEDEYGHPTRVIGSEGQCCYCDDER